MSNRTLLQSLERLPYKLMRSFGKRTRNIFFYNRLKHYSNYQRGSVKWLQATEKHFGGHTGLIKRRVISPNDTRTADELSAGMQGGDRMFHHNYAKHYAKHLAKFLPKENLVIVECGILRGSGLAMWSVLFPTAKIIGLDLDPSNFKENINFLKSKGAFQNGEPKIIQFDQLAPSTDELKNYLGENKIDIFIDDGMHTNEAIMNTLQVIYPLLNKHHVCFIEDNADVITEIKKSYSGSCINGYGELTVMENKC